MSEAVPSLIVNTLVEIPPFLSNDGNQEFDMEENIAQRGAGPSHSDGNSGVEDTETASLITNDHIMNDIPHDKPSNMGTPCFVYALTFFSAIGGFLFGYDTGVISGAMILLKDEFNLNSMWQEIVVSVTVGAAALFAVVGGFINDRFGRKPAILFGSVVFTMGAVLLGVSKNRTMLLIGRFILGIGIGVASMTVPMYIAESAPAELRGRLVTLNNVFITGGQFVASIMDGLFSMDKVNGWRYMLGLAGVPSVIQFAGFIFMPETPRWLVSKGHDTKAGEVLRRIRGSPHVEEELEEIRSNHLEDQQLRIDRGSRSVLWDMLTTPHVRRALILGCSLQMIQQICGINTVMYYSATIIKMSGVKSTSAAIWLSALTAGINFIFTLLGLYLVERVGRRKLTLGSLAGTFVSLVVLAISFQLASVQAPPVTWQELGESDHLRCSNYSWCEPCMLSKDCGFCFSREADGSLNGSCLSVARDSHGNPDSASASYGRCDNSTWMKEHSVEWGYDYCPTNIAWMSTFGLALYLAFFAPGMGPMPWTLNSEIYPLWARTTGNSVATMTNWIFNLLISLTFLTLTEVLTRYGAFWLYSSFALCGLVFLWRVLPETKGKHLEDIEKLFMKPWNFCTC